jgi:hypothetical protein
MMLKKIAYAFLAIGGGLVGGLLHSAFFPTTAVRAEESRSIKATTVELVDRSGKRVGLWDSNGSGANLAFFDQSGKKRAEFGLAGDGSPRIGLKDAGGALILSLDLSTTGRPRLIMSDPGFEGRVFLGVNEPDSPAPRAESDGWVLQFRGENSRPFATIGMRTAHGGGFTVRDKEGNEWRAPLATRTR